MTDYAKVLAHFHPDRKWSLNNNDYEQLTMLDSGSKPTKKSLDDAWPEVQTKIAAEIEAKTVAKANALTKLGLTADEAAALFG